MILRIKQAFEGRRVSHSKKWSPAVQRPVAPKLFFSQWIWYFWMLYFAYGSNLNLSDLNRWCRERMERGDFLEFHSTGVLRDFTARFTLFSDVRSGGVLDVVPKQGAEVPGALFRVVRADGWRLLDLKEGVPNHYERSEVGVSIQSGETIQAITYTVAAHRRQAHVIPNQHYVDVVCEGLGHWELDESHILKAAEG